MVLGTIPRVAFTGLTSAIGRPEEYLAMALKLTRMVVRKVDASIPSSAAAPGPEVSVGAKPAEGAEEAPKLMDVKDLAEKMAKWMIKVRVTKKCEKKSCRRGEGLMQTIQLVDRNGTEVEALLFDDAVNEKGDALVEGKVYFIRNGNIKPKNKLFSTINNNLVLYLNWRTGILPADNDPAIPSKVYPRVPSS